MKTKSDKKSFRCDFAPLERSLKQAKRSGGLVVTPEMMIVELGLTPRKVAQIEKENGVELDWFGPAYTVLKVHGLLPDSRSWEKWLVKYRQKRRAFNR